MIYWLMLDQWRASVADAGPSLIQHEALWIGDTDSEVRDRCGSTPGFISQGRDTGGGEGGDGWESLVMSGEKSDTLRPQNHKFI